MSGGASAGGIGIRACGFNGGFGGGFTTGFSRRGAQLNSMKTTKGTRQNAKYIFTFNIAFRIILFAFGIEGCCPMYIPFGAAIGNVFAIIESPLAIPGKVVPHSNAHPADGAPGLSENLRQAQDKLRISASACLSPP
jgi:hypothetical protein